MTLNILLFGIWAGMFILDILNKSEGYIILGDAAWTLYGLYLLTLGSLSLPVIILCDCVLLVMFFISGWWRYVNSIRRVEREASDLLIFLNAAVSALFVVDIGIRLIK